MNHESSPGDTTLEEDTTFEKETGRSRVVDAAKKEASHMKESIKQSGKEALEQGSQHAADTVGAYREVLSKSAADARDAECARIARGLEQAAESVSRVEDYFRSAAPEQLIQDTETYIRQYKSLALPALFLGGIALGRFLKAERPKSNSNPVGLQSERYETPYGETTNEQTL